MFSLGCFCPRTLSQNIPVIWGKYFPITHTTVILLISTQSAERSEEDLFIMFEKAQKQ